MIGQKLIAQGNTAEIFSYGDDKILKLFRDGIPKTIIDAEYEIGKIISGKADFIPNVFDYAALDNRFGIVYEKLDGLDLLSAALKKPSLMTKIPRIMAENQLKMHSIEADLPISVKNKLKRDIYRSHRFSETEQDKLFRYIDSLPDGNKLCHFDYHPGNIMMCGSKPYVIDWMTACTGNPCADIARSLLLLKYGESMHMNPIIIKLLHLLTRFAARKYLKMYLQKTGVAKNDVNAWLIPAAAARQCEWMTDHERKLLLKFVRKSLKNM